ncbi:MAG: heme-binding protein [Halobacteriales archaeon]
MTEPPQTDEGWFALHDFRRIDWDRWRDAPDRTREDAIESGIDYLDRHEAVEDAAAGASAVFTVLGHKADLLVLHFRPSLDALSAIERRFENTTFAAFTERTSSYISVTEVSGYVSDDYFEDPESVDEGTRRYIEGKLKPDIPDDEYVSFYPMAKRREPEYNWYDLDFEDRAELMAGHGDVGREYAGRISQVISSSVGLDDYEWGVTLFGDDPTDIKDIVYEMRFDEASSKYGEFGGFYIGRRFPPADLSAFMAGEPVPVDDTDEKPASKTTTETSAESQPADHADDDDTSSAAVDDDDGIRAELADLDIYAGQPHGEDVYALVLYSEAETEELFEELRGLRANFDHYDTHVKSAVYEAVDGQDLTAVVSIWETESAAETAAGFLSELPDVVRRAGETEDGFGTMGMFYTIKPDYRTDFQEKFGEVGSLLADMDGHDSTTLLANHEDENDMFIASQWDSREDAMAFFRSEEFGDTVDWGRDVLTDRPRHVFLA